MVDIICDETRAYYLSADELMLACELRRQNVAVFGRRHGQARFMGAVTGHAESPLVLVILHLDHDEGRVRSHFQRLVLAEEVRQAQEQLYREAERLREQQREAAAMAAADQASAAWAAYALETAAATE